MKLKTRLDKLENKLEGGDIPWAVFSLNLYETEAESARAKQRLFAKYADRLPPKFHSIFVNEVPSTEHRGKEELLSQFRSISV